MWVPDGPNLAQPRAVHRASAWRMRERYSSGEEAGEERRRALQ